MTNDRSLIPGDELSFHDHNPHQHDTVLIAIHGLDSSSASFDQELDDFGQHFRVITYDQRGHGKTRALGDRYDTAILAGDLRALIEHLGLADQRVVILGHSMGGRVAVRYASDHLANVRALIVEDIGVHPMTCLPREPAVRAACLQRRQTLVDRARETLDHAVFPDRDAVIQTLTPIYGRLRALDYAERKVVTLEDGRLQLTVRPSVAAAMWLENGTEDLAGAWRAIAHAGLPRLVVRPANRALSPITDWDLALFAETETRVIAVPDAEHNVHRTQPRAFLAAVHTLLDTIS